MGITTVLETEDGKKLDVVEDSTNVIGRLVPGPEDKTYRVINRIDWYGDTVFNHLQAADFLQEWDRLKPDPKDPESAKVLAGIRALAERLVGANHIYLKFYGD